MRSEVCSLTSEALSCSCLGNTRAQRLTAGVNDIGYPEQGEEKPGADVVNRQNVGRQPNLTTAQVMRS